MSHTMLSKDNGLDQGFDDYALTSGHKNPHVSISSNKVTDLA